MAEAAAVATVVSVLGSAYYTEKKQSAEKKATKRANQLAKEQAAIEREAQEEAQRELERKNRNLLAQQQSSYKARLGASGLTSQAGSGQVVLDAMEKETDMENKYQQQKTRYSLKSLNNQLKQTNNRNLLTLNKLRVGQQENVLNAATTLGKMSSDS
jgi:hypothetical protein